MRQAFFAQGRTIALRHELFAVAGKVAAQGRLDLARFEADWDSGRYKAGVIAESKQGWHSLKVDGSPTFVLPDGRRFSNPAVGEIDFDEEQYILRRYTPYPGDPLAVYREMMESIVRKT